MKEKINNFKRISENRVNKILSLLNQMKNLTNTSFYEYTNDDIKKMMRVIREELENTENVLLKSNKSNKFKL